MPTAASGASEKVVGGLVIDEALSLWVPRAEFVNESETVSCFF